MPSPTSQPEDTLPLLPIHTTSPPSRSPISRSRLSARRYPLTDKGKARAEPPSDDLLDNVELHNPTSASSGVQIEKTGRNVTVIFSNESESGGGNLEIWVEEGESVGYVKDQIRHLRPQLAPLSLRLIHSGRLLTDGILLLPWLRQLEERVRRQAAGVGGDVESVLKDVGLAEDDETAGGTMKKKEAERVWLHCNVGGVEMKGKERDSADEPSAPRRRGFDVLLDAGLSLAEVQQMRRQFYESRGEEVPEGMDLGDVSDEHARALEEQWIEGDMTADTAATSTEGMYTSILHGLLTGFLLPLTPWFFFREPPLPNFFDADAEAARVEGSQISARVNEESGIGGEVLPGIVFGRRMQMGIFMGTLLNVAFGLLRHSISFV